MQPPNPPSTPPKPPTAHFADRLLPGFATIYVFGIIFLAIGINSAWAFSIEVGVFLLLVDLAGIALLDWRGYLNLGGILDLQEFSQKERRIVYGFCFLLFPVAIPLYLGWHARTRPRQPRMDSSVASPSRSRSSISAPVKPSTQQMVRVYTGHLRSAQHKFQKDANKLARKGWRVQSVVTTQSAAIGVFVAPGVGVGKSKAHKLTVIYQR